MSHAIELTRPARLPWHLWLLLVVYVTTLFLLDLGGARSFTGHECFVAEGAREMLVTGDWLVPRINGEPWLEKPPLPHWTVALSASYGGLSEFTARMPSAILGLVGILLITDLAVRWLGPLKGILTGLIQATTFYTITYARLAEADVYLWCIVTACLWVFGRAWVTDEFPSFARRWSGCLFLILLGLSQLAKGPLFGAVLALMPCVAFLVLQRRFAAWQWFVHPIGLGLMVLIAMAWPAAILWQHPDAARLWWIHTFGRVGGDGALNPEAFWYYVVNVPWQLAPWTFVAAVGGWRSLRRAWHEKSRVDRFLWAWFAVPFTVLSCVSAKHHHYLIYALPPCSFWAADGVLVAFFVVRNFMRRFTWQVMAAAGLLVVVAAGNLAMRRWGGVFADDGPWLCGMVLLGGSMLTVALARQRTGWALAVLFATVWSVYAYVHAEMLWKTDRYHEESALLARLNDRAPGDTPLLVFGLEPSRLLLYTSRRLEVFVDLDDLEARARAVPEALVLTTVGHEYQLRARGKPQCVDKMPSGRCLKSGPFGQLAAFRMAWRKGKDGMAVSGTTLDTSSGSGHSIAVGPEESQRGTVKLRAGADDTVDATRFRR